MCESPLGRNAASLSPSLLVDDEDNARPCINEFLRVEAIVSPSAPVMPRALDYRIASDHYLGKIKERHCPQVPYDVSSSGTQKASTS
jgi:hypothetical protein